MSRKRRRERRASTCGGWLVSWPAGSGVRGGGEALGETGGELR